MKVVNVGNFFEKSTKINLRLLPYLQLEEQKRLEKQQAAEEKAAQNVSCVN